MTVSRDDALVSIIMPLFNSERFVGETLDSVLAQTYGNWELVVVDDCSTDRSPDIVKAFSQRDGRDRVRLYSLASNQGAAKA